MCGIAGEIAPQGHTSVPVVAEMLRNLAHRGPDGVGLLDYDGITIGCVRLAITGPAAMTVPVAQRNAALAYNGELYMSEIGSGSDAHWLLRRLAHDDLPGFDYLDGMFALAFVERAERRVTLARDHFGIKPLFVRWRPGRMIFASEFEPLWRAYPSDPVVDPVGLVECLGLGTQLGDTTLFEGIVSLPPGHAETVRLDAGSLHRESRSIAVPTHSSEGHTAELASAVEASVLACAATEQPLGLFLSGGLDSSAIAAVLALHGVKELRTFSLIIGTDGVHDLGELRLPGTAWRRWRHHAWSPSSKDVYAAFARVLSFTSYPCFPASAAYTLLLAEAAQHAGIRVALSGEGADELFAGYESYCAWNGDNDPTAFYLASEPMKRALRLVVGKQDDLSAALHQHLEINIPGGPKLARLLAMERRVSLRPLLARVDETSMRCGVEVRVPFLHGTLPAIAEAASADADVPLTHTKPLLREALRELLGDRAAAVPKRPLRISAEKWTTSTLASDLTATVGRMSASLPIDRSEFERLLDELHHRPSRAALLVAQRLYQVSSFVERFSLSCHPPSEHCCRH